MILELLDKAGLHLHRHDEVLFDDDMDQVKQCRCGHLEHYQNEMHEYVYKRRRDYTRARRAELLAQYGEYGENYEL